MDAETAVKMVAAIETLRAGEGDSVTILCDNPDFNNGPNNVVECNGEWTDWQDSRFGGATLLEALEAAVTQRRKHGHG